VGFFVLFSITFDTSGFIGSYDIVSTSLDNLEFNIYSEAQTVQKDAISAFADIYMARK